MEQSNDILFTESQRFTQWWVWLILLPMNLFWIVVVYFQFIKSEPIGYKPMPELILAILIISSILVSVFILSCHLKLHITTIGLAVRFFPFHRRFNMFAWDELSLCYTRTYSPIREYGGWGYRIGIFGKGNAWNVSGNQGLQLEFGNKKKLLIGTKRSDEIDSLLKALGTERRP